MGPSRPIRKRSRASAKTKKVSILWKQACSTWIMPINQNLPLLVIYHMAFRSTSKNLQLWALRLTSTAQSNKPIFGGPKWHACAEESGVPWFGFTYPWSSDGEGILFHNHWELKWPSFSLIEIVNGSQIFGFFWQLAMPISSTVCLDYKIQVWFFEYSSVRLLLIHIETDGHVTQTFTHDW